MKISEVQFKVLSRLNNGEILHHNRSVPAWGGGCWIIQTRGQWHSDKISYATLWGLRQRGLLKEMPPKPDQRLSEDYYTISEEGKVLFDSLTKTGEQK